MNALMRPALYEAYHGIHNLAQLDSDSAQEGIAMFDVVGPICESSDILGQQRPLPATTCEGDVMLVSDAGAYGMAMANTYNLRALPVESVLGEDFLIDGPISKGNTDV